METFHPAVIIDGQTVHPEGWMYILAFAIAGIPWAIEEASKPEFLETCKDYERRKAEYWCEKGIEAAEKRIAELKAKLKTLKG